MSGHCHHEDVHAENRRVLWIVLALNFSMFILELWQGVSIGSSSLLADAADFFSDSFSYVITLIVLAAPLRVRAKASLAKAVMMLLLAAGALSQGVWHLFHGVAPDAHTMGWVSLLALAANLGSAALLFRSRGQDSNMRSVWLCSRNDALNNIMILIAAGFVFYTASPWPDVIAAVIIAWVEGASALSIIRQAQGELRNHAH